MKTISVMMDLHVLISLVSVLPHVIVSSVSGRDVVFGQRCHSQAGLIRRCWRSGLCGAGVSLDAIASDSRSKWIANLHRSFIVSKNVVLIEQQARRDRDREGAESPRN
jgi:hypothetical protein